MRVVGVIPARFHSTRFEGKVIAEIAGKPMIQHVYEKANQSQRLDEIIIACDDSRVQMIAEDFGARAVLTDPDHPSGSDRMVEVIKDIDCDIVINVQGDEPLIQPNVIDQLVEAMIDGKDTVMATVIKATTDKKELDDPNVVKVVVDQNGFALYFSRSRIPFERNSGECAYFKHLGIYAYTKDFLLKYTSMSKSKLELTESLEQLRVLEAGYKIKTITTDIETIGVDTKEDLLKVEKYLKEHQS